MQYGDKWSALSFSSEILNQDIKKSSDPNKVKSFKCNFKWATAHNIWDFLNQAMLKCVCEVHHIIQ